MRLRSASSTGVRSKPAIDVGRAAIAAVAGFFEATAFLPAALTALGRVLMETGDSYRIRTRSAQAGFVAGDHQALDLAGAFVDLGDLRVAEVTLDRHFLRIAHAGVDLHGLVGDPHRRFRRGELGDGGFV